MSEVIEHDVLNTAASTAAMNSVMVMEQWAGGEVYSEERWIERARLAAQKTLEGMFELGRALIVLKEHTEHGRFRDITELDNGNYAYSIKTLQIAERYRRQVEYLKGKLEETDQRVNKI